MSDLTKLDDCKNGVTGHLITYHLSKTRLSEYYERILARTGLFDWKYEICAKLVDLPLPSACFYKALASTEKKLQFSRSHRCHESIIGKRCGHIRNVEMDAETLRLYRPGWNR